MTKEFKKDLVYQRIKNDIESGLYRIGQKLPKELDFAREMGVSFITMRSALSKLEEDGLISRIPSKGTFIRDSINAKSNKILLLLPDYSGMPNAEYPFNQRLILGIVEQAYLMNLDVEIAKMSDDELKTSGYRGVIWDRPPEMFYPAIARLTAAGVPQVTVNRQCPGIPSVACDYPAAIRQGVRYLQTIGHQYIGLVDLNPERAQIFRERSEAFCNQLRYSGIANAEDYLYKVYHETAKTEHWPSMGEWLRRHPEITAVVVSNVYLQSFQIVLDNEQLNVPRDLSVIQWGENSRFNRDAQYPYSILTEPRREVGKLALELLEKQFRHEMVSSETQLVDGELIMRKGCALPRTLQKTHILT